MTLLCDVDLDHAVPFAAAFEPWVTRGEAALVLPPRFGASAHRDLTRSLLDRLSQHGALAALELFDAQGRGDYRSFVARAPDLLVDQFPGFAALADLLTDQWIAATTTLVDRIDREIDQLPVGPVGEIEKIWPRLGDPHHDGHHASMVQADGSPPVLLKPRSLAPEAAFFALTDQSPDLLPDGAPWIVDLGDHGWMAFVEQGPVVGAPDYWHRVGRMLALLQLVGATDLHQSNVIGTGAQLVPIDLECMATPEVVGRTGVGATRAGAFLRDSAIGTGLLPRALQVDGPIAVEWCGLTGRAGQLNGRWRAGWTKLGTDDIGRHQVPMKTPTSSNIAVDPRGRTVPLDLEQVVRGYQAEQERWVRHGDPARELVGLRSRLILRPTATYAQTIAATLAPSVLRSASQTANALTELPELAPDLASALGPEGTEALVAAERAALARLDIPLVWAEGADVIVDDGTVVAGAASRPGIDRCRSRLRRWADPAWRRAETDLVRLSLEPVAGPPTGRGPSAAPSATASAPASALLVDPTASGDPLALAVGIAESLAADAIDLEAGRLGWVEAVPQGRSGRLQAVLAPTGLYHGGEGIAVFLACLAAVTGDGRWRSLARRALPPSPDPADTSMLLTTGWTGWAWAASVIAEQLGDEDLAAEAAGLFDHPGSIPVVESGDPLDLIGGWAGPLAACCAVARRNGDAASATVASAFGRAVAAAARSQLDDEVKVRALSRLGMAHGSFGVTLALGAATALGDDPLTAEVFDRMVALEDDRIARRGHVGARIDQGKRRVPSRTWCWGVAGYLMATAQPWFADHDRSLSEEASFAVLAGGSRTLDHACCGTAGHLEAAVTARDVLGIADAPALVDELVDHLARPPLHFHPGSPFDSPGLFRGRAGVGQALLRAHDSTLPSALALT